MKVSKIFQKNCLNQTILSDHNASELEINNKMFLENKTKNPISLETFFKVSK